MWYWLHHLLQPHCADCQREAEVNKICRSCNSLREQLEYARQENQQLLTHIMTLTAKPEEPVPAAAPQIPVGKMTTWRTHRQLLEERDRETARLLRDTQRQDAEIAKLEKEVGITEENKNVEAVGGST